MVKLEYKALKFDPFNDILSTITVKQLIEVSKMVEVVWDSVGNSIELMIEVDG